MNTRDKDAAMRKRVHQNVLVATKHPLFGRILRQEAAQKQQQARR